MDTIDRTVAGPPALPYNIACHLAHRVKPVQPTGIEIEIGIAVPAMPHDLGRVPAA
jgi:hypothetical protein